MLRGSVPFVQLVAKAESSPKPLGFVQALLAAKFPAIIAEVKRASPSRGIIRSDLEPVDVARGFTNGGAACLSVLTDRIYFHGDPQFVSNIRVALPNIPILRKDFIIDQSQIWESRLLGADAILLIAAALDDNQLDQLAAEAFKAKLDILIEVHNSEELSRVGAIFDKKFLENHHESPSKFCLGINNRDLHTFAMDLDITRRLIGELGNNSVFPLVVAESGMHTADDVVRLAQYGAGAFLIGEGLVREGDPGENLKTLCEKARLILPSIAG
mgnify:CR=1 FL=1